MRFWVLFIAVAVACVLGSPRESAAQTEGFSINRFDAAERGSDWFVGESLDLRGHGRGALGIVGDYAYKPLVLYNLDGSERSVLVQHQLFTHIGGSVNLWNRLRLSTGISLGILSASETPRFGPLTIEPQTGTTLGDVRLGADLRLVGEYLGPAQLALGVQ